MNADSYPDVVDPNLVGTYSPLAKAGGGYVWDDVLEYRVWCHPERGSSDLADGSDYYHAFATYTEALAFSRNTEGAEAPLALVRQLNTSTNLLLATIVMSRKCASPNGQWNSFAALDARRIQSLISFRRTRPPIGWIFFGA